MLIGLLIAIVAILVIFFLVGCLYVLSLSGPPKEWEELRIKRSELDAVIERYGLNTEEELREYLWFNCGTALVIEEE